MRRVAQIGGLGRLAWRAAAAAAAIAAVVVALGATAAAQPRRGQLTQMPESADPPVVWLYSFGIGEVVFEKFGHSAMCLEYADPRLFVCFNYGVTDFSNPTGLVWGFMRSQQKFWVEPVHESEIMRFYTRYEDRTVWRQRLPLEPAQARQIEARLWNDLEEENRYYIYEHFKDNCTTRLRDMIDEATGGKLRAGADAERHPLTLREFGQRGMAEFMPLLAISDFITGRRLDRRPTMWEAMFHPDELRAAVEQRLGAPSEVLYTRRGPDFPTHGPTGRQWVVLISVLLTAPLALAKWRGRGETLATAIAVLPLIGMGVLIWSIFFLVSIEWVRWNEAMLLFVPFDVVIPFLGAARRRRYAQVRLGIVILVSLLCAVGLFKQPLWVPILVAFLPLSLLAFDWPRRSPAVAAPVTSPAT